MRKELLIVGGAIGGLLLAAKLAQAQPSLKAEVTGFGITERSPASLGIAVPPGTNILGRTTYKNNLITPGSTIYLGFFLGEIRAGVFYLYYFTYDGVDYFIGSLGSTTAPAKDASATVDISSVAAFSCPAGLTYWDAFVWVGVLTGTVRTITSGGRVIGIRKDDFGFISPYHSATYEDVLKVISGAEITAFSVVSG